MSAAPPIPAIRHEVVVDAPPQDAFAAFGEGINAWWPREYTWSGDLLERMEVEGRPGGFLREVGAQGRRLDWGRVGAWEPPRRLAFSWMIGPDRAPEPGPGSASQVEVTFEPAPGDRTRVTVVHAGWERHGEGGARYRDAMAAAGSWEQMLERYASVVERRHDEPWLAVTT